MAITKMRQSRRRPPAATKASVEVSAAVDPKPRRRGSKNWSAPAGSKGGPIVGSHRPIAKAMHVEPGHIASMQTLGGILYGWALQYIRRLVRKWRAALMATKMLKSRGVRDKGTRPVRAVRGTAPQVRAAPKADVSAIESRRHQAEDRMHQLELRRLQDELAAVKGMNILEHTVQCIDECDAAAALAAEVDGAHSLTQKIHQLEEQLHSCESGRAELSRELQTLKTRLLKISKLEMKLAELEAEVLMLRSQNGDLRHKNDKLSRFEEDARTLGPRCAALEQEIQELKLDLDMERSRNKQLAELGEECEEMRHKKAELERETRRLSSRVKELERYEEECSGLREDYNNALAAQVQADDTLNSTQKALDKSNHALGLTRDALAHSRREADDLKDTLDQSQMSCAELEAELAGTGAEEGILAEENLRLQEDLERLIQDLEQVQDDNKALHMQLAGGNALGEEIKTLRRQLNHAEDKLRQNQAVDNSQVEALQDELKALQAELNLSEQKFQTELVQHQHTQEELQAVQLQLETGLRSPDVELVAPVTPGGDSSPDVAELRAELREANHALKHANKQIRSLSRSNSPAKVRSTGADELEKARLQHELNTALNELATTPRGTPLPNRADVIMQGYLKKHGSFTWNERWATLDGNYFRVHNTQSDVKPKYVIPLNRLKSVQKHGDHKFTVIHMDGEALELDADDKKVCQSWLQAFKKAKDVARADSAPPLEPLTPSRIEQEPLHAFQERFVELLVQHGGHQVQRLDEMHKTGASAAEASLWVGWRDNEGDECHEERTVVTVLTPSRPGGKGSQDVHPCAMMCFNFSPKAQSLRLELDLPSEEADKPDSPVHAVRGDSVLVSEAPEANLQHVEPELEQAPIEDGQGDASDRSDEQDEGGDLNEDDLRAVFDLFDVDQSGEISCDELCDAMEALGLEVEDGQVDRIFASIDKGMDGSMDFAEFCQVINGSGLRASGAPEGDNFESGMREVFNLFDTDQSGEIDVKELGDAMEALGIPTTPELVQQTMQNVDSSRDGFIDFGEFCAVMGPMVDVEAPSKGGGKSSASAEQLDMIAGAFEVQLALGSVVFDLDGEGIINAADLGDAMEGLGLEVTDEEAVHLLSECGKNIEDILDIDEFTMIVLPLWNKRSSFPDF